MITERISTVRYIFKEEKEMDIANMIANNGFAIVACIGMGLYVREITKANQATIMSIMEKHKEETDKMTAAIQNNTLIVQRLLDTLEKEAKDVD